MSKSRRKVQEGHRLATLFILRSWVSALCFFAALSTTSAGAADSLPAISHGPLLGPVSEDSAALWLRTTTSARVVFSVLPEGGEQQAILQEMETSPDLDNTCIARFKNLKPDTGYRYTVGIGQSSFEGTFRTMGPSSVDRPLRLVYGYGYKPQEDRMKKDTSIFVEMAAKKPDLVLFLGDFPYTSAGEKQDLEEGHKTLRSIVGFRQLTSTSPTAGIYDDHDFGPNDCDGTHPNADAALAVFRSFWPNPSYGENGNQGIYCSFIAGPVEYFLLDGRYHARKAEGTMLGARQFEWLCRGLKASKSRYKVLVSGTQFERVKSDNWAGKEYLGERNRLFDFIRDNDISGVLAISGDVHRSDIHKIPIGKDRFFYDFTPGALAREQRPPPSLKKRPVSMIHSYGEDGDNNMFGEMEFFPSANKETALVFRSHSAKKGIIFEYALSPEDLHLQ